VINASDHDDVQVAAEQALNFLMKQLEELHVLANGYPRNWGTPAAVWIDGAALASWCDALTGAFSSKGLPREEELASRLATGMAYQVMGHYPEQIFPRVLRNSRCREAIDDLDGAIQGYQAILSDFRVLGRDYLLEDDEAPDKTDRTILESVYEAAKRLGELKPEQATALKDLQASIQRRLALYGSH
jgi:hypothetical protein